MTSKAQHDTPEIRVIVATLPLSKLGLFLYSPEGKRGNYCEGLWETVHPMPHADRIDDPPGYR
jgi:hypothetical protein